MALSLVYGLGRSTMPVLRASGLGHGWLSRGLLAALQEYLEAKNREVSEPRVRETVSECALQAWRSLL